jgi:hypothetical protein
LRADAATPSYLERGGRRSAERRADRLPKLATPAAIQDAKLLSHAD